MLVVAATELELRPLLNACSAREEWHGRLWQGCIGHRDVRLLATGPGGAATGYWLGRTLALLQPQMVLNVGVCGSFTRHFSLGDVVEITQDTFADLGAWNADGEFLDMQQLGLAITQNHTHIIYNYIVNHTPLNSGLPQVRGISVETVSGSELDIKKRIARWNPEVETMEGAAFFLSCTLAGVAFGAVRAVSNYVEPRNRANWQMELAIQQLGNSALQIIEKWV